MSLVNELKFDRNGLLPAIISNAEDGEPLMLVWMNAEAVERTVETGNLYYWSRSRRRLRMKGETSGHVRTVREIRLDCAGASLLIAVEPGGAVCAHGHGSSFHRLWEGGELRAAERKQPEADIMEAVYQVIRQRREHPSEDSYVSSLFRKGLDKILGKIGEEATEAAVAGKGGEPKQVVYEVADLFFHTLVLLAYYDLPPELVHAELRRRFGLSGLAEKASRGK